MTRSFLDTNVLVYLFDNKEPEKKARAQEVFEWEAGTGSTCLSTQVLQEFYVSVTRKLSPPLPSEIAEERVRDFSRLPLVKIEFPTILASIERSREYMLSFWDALIR